MAKSADFSGSSISLWGKWQFCLDSLNQGIVGKWYESKKFDDCICLPSTTDEAHKGRGYTKANSGTLTRLYPYYGAAWYQREVDIPKAWSGKRITFHMEKTRKTTVWVDGKEIGTQDGLVTQHMYDLTSALTYGRHRITVRVSNDVKEMPPVGISHQIGDQTQTNWNGILGRIELQASDPVWIDEARLYPNIEEKTVKFRIRLGSEHRLPQTANITIQSEMFNTDKPLSVPTANDVVNLDKVTGWCTVILPLGDKMKLWDEFTPTLYRFNISFTAKDKGNTYSGKKTITTGLRVFKTEGTQFSINGKRIFLRGDNDCGLYPFNGYGPMDVEGWVKVFKTTKSYGINHVRYHTWCPPEAAFQAADLVGLYLQPELPVWAPIGHSKKKNRDGDIEIRLSAEGDPIDQRTAFLTEEGKRILKEFGNYASFTMFALGNEMSGSRETMSEMIRQFRSYDNRHLYAEGSNNFFWHPSLAEGDDYWTTTMTGGTYSAGNYRPNCKGKDVRSSYPVDTVGHINNVYVGTMYDYSEGIKDVPVPVIGHEVGQYQVYPDFADSFKYTGVLKPMFYEKLIQGIRSSGLERYASDFVKASGALQVLCYKEEIETALRTPGFGGFQILDLQDYHWGPCMVGITDAFMDNKGYVSPVKWREFCSASVPLIRMPKFIWTNNEVFTARAEMANYGPKALSGNNISWKMTDTSGRILYKGNIQPVSIPQGGLTELGNIRVNFNNIKHPTRLNVTLVVDGYKNSWPVWVYPAEQRINEGNVVIVRKFDNTVVSLLKQGRKVLFIVDKTALKEPVRGVFSVDFWSYVGFRKYNPPGTMGLLCDPHHPIFANFPTDSHTNWQWWNIAKNSPAMNLGRQSVAIEPLIRVIDNVFTNRNLCLLFEAKCGKGSLMVSSIDLQKDSPEIKALYRGVLNYMNSSEFQPKIELLQLQLPFKN